MHQWVVAMAELAAGLLAAVVLWAALRRLASRVEGTRWQGDDIIVSFLGSLLPWSAVLGGVWVATLGLPLAVRWRGNVGHVLLAAAILIVTYATARGAGALVRAGALSHTGTSGSATIFVNIIRMVVLAIGLLVLLNSLGIAIAPLLTALGVGGLAVALALQDTLTNLFAGVHILASGKVQPGDFVALDNGMEGYVVDTNWRNTTVRQLPNNLVIVPNATLAGTVLTNYHQPDQEMSVIVQVGVSYDSDLDKVERITCDVAAEVMKTVDGGVPTHQPLIRFHTFGESSIDFSVILRAAEVTARYLIVHEFIKRLHCRYQAEGIQIPFPIRTIVHAQESGLPEGAVGQTVSA